MNKKVFGRKLSRSRPAREALFASLARAMMLSGKIVTTRAKAKAVQPDLEKFVTLAKKGELSGRRRILASLDNSKDALEALFKNVVPVFVSRTSGFTRIISLPRRKGDNAQVVRMEWTETIIKNEELKTKKEKTLKKAEKIKKTVKVKEKLK
ncbi:MAG: 50S ribosomal protein L17 [Candidatus Woesebacteria bacterium GW2011_GWB1_39_10]|uniref:50S ribosomal protein L17 n=2 Tax=Candidatus Woeseibacteriota TaxID=1752722 RepID=A0A0G0PRN7_9BACT|nr:MAG: 50S ribosomal protein L17 [Candidatus Woesebacteria bacterium GW2011_GWB1_39_10]KKS90991.1 MAG: 50S ribosomal protein L17 [Candidatus Woesebacteria bacterium GW2011_GWA1_43_12]